MRRALLAALGTGLLWLAPPARADVPILRSCATDSASTDRPDAVPGLQIHVIYVGEFRGEDFEKLAHENGGVFVAIGG